MFSNLIKFTFLIICICFTNVSKAQSKRDNIINKIVLPVLNSDRYKDNSDYNEIKTIITKLEKDYGYEASLKRRLLEPSYYHNDLSFFKAELTTLIKDYGFDVAYMKGTENYYSDLITGQMAVWFKEMYLKNHVIWLSNNFDKQIEKRKLNTINEKDQSITAFAMKVLNIDGLDSLQQTTIKEYLSEYHFKNIEPVLSIVKNKNIFPNDKSFALLQGGFDTVLIHNFQFKKNLNEVWNVLFPTIKQAYLKNEITNVIFQNYDFYHYQQYGSLVFGSYSIEQLPEQFRQTEKGPIPIKDEAWLENIKKEFKWGNKY